MKVRFLLDPNSMLNSEHQIQQALNDAGKLATGQALSQFYTNGTAIELNGEEYTSKGKKNYESSYGKLGEDRNQISDRRHLEMKKN